jgi:hypothetical protein
MVINLVGGTGNDVLAFAYSDASWLNPYGETYTVATWDTDYTVTANMYGGLGADLLWGSEEPEMGDHSYFETLYGEGGDDDLCGNGGNDVLEGGAGHDSLHGGGDDDVIRGGRGNDVIVGGDGDDWMTGEAGADEIHDESGTDIAFGGAGNDEIYLAGASSREFGNRGNDLCSAAHETGCPGYLDPFAMLTYAVPAIYE